MLWTFSALDVPKKWAARCRHIPCEVWRRRLQMCLFRQGISMENQELDDNRWWFSIGYYMILWYSYCWLSYWIMINHHWMMFMDIMIFIPIGSMYGIYANIWAIWMVNVTIYSIHVSYGILDMVKHGGFHQMVIFLMRICLFSRSMLDTDGTTYDIRDSKVSKIVEI